MYLKSRNILNLSCENRLYRVSNEKNIIDYIKEFFKKIIEYIKKFIDKVKQFFNFKQKKVATKIELVKKEVSNIKVDKINEVIDAEVISDETNNIISKDIILAALDYQFNANTIDEIMDFCKYRCLCNVAFYLNNNIKDGNISDFNNIDVVASIKKISVPVFAKKISKICDFTSDVISLGFFNSDSTYWYDYDILKGDFSKITTKPNIKKGDLKVDISTDNLKKILNKFDNEYNNILANYIERVNADLSNLTNNINKLEKNLNNELSGTGDNVSKDINNKLKILGQHIKFASTFTTEIINNVNLTVETILDIIKNTIK